MRVVWSLRRYLAHRLYPGLTMNPGVFTQACEDYLDTAKSADHITVNWKNGNHTTIYRRSK